MNVTLQQFKIFHAVARNLSFSKAAKELYISQPYVSNQIRRIEDHYGAPLFIRSQPTIALTDLGSLVFDRISLILKQIEQLETAVSASRGVNRGSVSFGTTQSVGNHLLPEVMTSFKRTHPDVVVHARIGNTEDALGWIESGEVDLAVCPQRSTSPDLTSEPLYREQLIVICPPWMEVSDPLQLAHLARMPRVVREEGSLTRARMLDVLADFPSGRDYVAELDGTTAVNEAVAAGLGVSLVPESSTRAWLEAGLVRRCDIADTELHHDFYLTFPRQRYLTAAGQALINHLRLVSRDEFAGVTALGPQLRPEIAA